MVEEKNKGAVVSQKELEFHTKYYLKDVLSGLTNAKLELVKCISNIYADSEEATLHAESALGDILLEIDTLKDFLNKFCKDV